MRDQGVIKGYLRQRQAIEADEEQDPESLKLTGDPEHDEIVKKKWVWEYVSMPVPSVC